MTKNITKKNINNISKNERLKLKKDEFESALLIAFLIFLIILFASVITNEKEAKIGVSGHAVENTKLTETHNNDIQISKTNSFCIIPKTSIIISSIGLLIVYLLLLQKYLKKSEKNIFYLERLKFFIITAFITLFCVYIFIYKVTECDGYEYLKMLTLSLFTFFIVISYIYYTIIKDIKKRNKVEHFNTLSEKEFHNILTDFRKKDNKKEKEYYNLKKKEKEHMLKVINKKHKALIKRLKESRTKHLKDKKIKEEQNKKFRQFYNKKKKQDDIMKTQKQSNNKRLSKIKDKKDKALANISTGLKKVFSKIGIKKTKKDIKTETVKKKKEIFKKDKELVLKIKKSKKIKNKLLNSPKRKVSSKFQKIKKALTPKKISMKEEFNEIVDELSILKTTAQKERTIKKYIRLAFYNLKKKDLDECERLYYIIKDLYENLPKKSQDKFYKDALKLEKALTVKLEKVMDIK